MFYVLLYNVTMYYYMFTTVVNYFKRIVDLIVRVNVLLKGSFGETIRNIFRNTITRGVCNLNAPKDVNNKATSRDSSETRSRLSVTSTLFSGNLSETRTRMNHLSRVYARAYRDECNFSFSLFLRTCD